MKRREIYELLEKLNLKETVNKEFKRNWTQVGNAQLEQFLKAHMGPKKPDEVKKEAPVEEEKKEAAGSKIERLIEVLVKKRILLPSEIKYINQ